MLFGSGFSLRTYEDQRMFFNLLKPLFSVIRENAPKLLIPKIPTSFQEKRKILLETFKESEIRKICAECHGRCCSQIVCLPPMEMSDIFYIFAQNPHFELPKLDWDFLRQKNKIERKHPTLPLYCLFSGPAGCRLQDDRPLICLTATCHKLRILEKIKAVGLGHDSYYDFYNQMHAQLGEWCIHLRKTNLPRFSEENIIRKILVNDPTCGIHRLIVPLLPELIKGAD